MGQIVLGLCTVSLGLFSAHPDALTMIHADLYHVTSTALAYPAANPVVPCSSSSTGAHGRALGWPTPLPGALFSRWQPISLSLLIRSPGRIPR